MKKIIWFVVALVLAALFAKVFANAWQSAKFFQEHGREATLKIGRKYNASIWSSPLPLKKVHTYVAVLAPDHEVLLESDQDLKENTEIFGRFLLRDSAAEAHEKKLWSFSGAIRLKSEADGTPVKLADTNIFDRAVDKAMGPMGDNVYVAPRPVAENAPSRDKPTVPFLIGGALDNPFELIWRNTSIGEWVVLAAWLVLIKMIVLHAWSTPFDPTSSKADKKGFVHPSMRHLEGEAKPRQPVQKLSYTPKPEDHDYIGIAKPKNSVPPPPDTPVVGGPAATAPATPPPAEPAAPKSISLPPGASDPNAPRPQPTEPYSTATTAPEPLPNAGNGEPALKLTRKPKSTGGTTPPTPPAGEPPAA